MNEAAIMGNVVAAVDEQVHPCRVLCLRLEIGQLAGVASGFLRSCFDVCARGTALEGATLEIDEIEGRGRCLRCERELGMTSLLELCPCGSAEIRVLAGEELRIRDVEVELH
jgi:hydrogenase nickel incorporation protein HypA/HybF